MNDATNRPEVVEVVEVVEVTTAVIHGVIGADEIAAFFDRSFPAVAEAIGAQDAGIAGAAFARFHRPPGDTFDLEVGFPTLRPVEARGDVRPGTLPAGRVARLVHRGSYDELPGSWGRLRAWVTAEGMSPSGDLWEAYVTEPSPEMDPADLRTELYLPLGG
jgi:effector-binding domain-containing protein